MSLSQQVIRGGFWLQMSRIIQLGSNFVVSVILARLLLPADFGLAGMVTLYGAFVAQFTMLGLTLGIIQKREVSQRQLSTLFWINMGFNLLTGALVAAAAPLAARYYHQPELVPLILCYCITFLVSPFFQIHRRLLERRIDFGKIAMIEVIAAIGSGLLGITLAILGFGVYSIVWQTVSLNFVYMVTTRISIRWRPDFVFSLSDVKELVFFSLKMKAARVANFLERNIDFLILSKLFNATLFGYYSLAYRIMYFPVRRISYVFSEILFPAFSCIQDDLGRIREGYLRSVQIVTMATLPLSVLLGAYSRPLIIFVLGRKWLPISGMLFLLSVAGLLQSIETVSDSLYPAINRPHLLIWIELIRTVVTGIAIVIGGNLGLFQVSVMILIARTLLFTGTMIIMNRLIQINLREFVKLIAGPLISSLVMFSMLTAIKGMAFKSPLFLGLSIALGLGAYVAGSLLMNFNDLEFIFKKIFRKNETKEIIHA